MPRVMIVDDDRNTVKLLQTLLELDGFDVINAPRGQMALNQALQQRPDAFLIDFHLVDMDGTDLVRSLRATADFRQSPIVMVSGLDIEDQAMNAGASVFLTKPFEPGKLADLFNGLLAQDGGTR